jgi:hypothetical protein
MATPFTQALDLIISQFQAAFENPTLVRRDERPHRALLEMRDNYGVYQVHLREVLRVDGTRKYAYYVLHQSRLIIGFDNAPNPRALRLKYGKNYVHHRLELVPHRHTQDKAAVELTGEMTCGLFIAWLQANLPN